MKNFDSRTYSINDFLEWEKNDQLELSPKFQRKSVWSETGRSYLMDTIIRGLHIPKVFIRQKINFNNRKSIREVVDGQQRLRTILSYINDGFKISQKHNEKFGGYYFSELSEIDEDIQSSILNYEISVDLLVNMPDSDVLDVFSRLNSYAVTLNEQEKINANHFSSFKILADELAKKYNSFWIESKIFSEQKILRMEDVNLTADLLIACIEGIKEKKKIRFYYDKYEKDFTEDINLLQERFCSIMNIIIKVFKGTLSNTSFKRIHIFYSLFTALYHIYYGIPGIERNFILDDTKERTLSKILMSLSHIDYIYEQIENNNEKLTIEEKNFIDASRRATTDTSKRKLRTEYIIKLIANDFK